METVLALEAAGVPASRVAMEVFAPELAGGKLDLVVDPPAEVVIELKYPRDARTGNPDTMTMGELARDFLRVAAVTAEDRWVVQLLHPRIIRYLRNVEARHGLAWTVAEGETLDFDPDVIAGLPGTAVAAIGSAALPHRVIATCEVAASIDDQLGLYAYRVAAPDTERPIPITNTITAPKDPEPSGRATRDGARREILASAARVLARSGRGTFTVKEIVADMHPNGTG
jgi:hypothetical protein